MARRGSLSFLERSPRIIGAIGLAFILAGTVLGLMLQGGMLTKTYSVTAIFSDAGGIRPGDRVTVAGLPAGRVEGLRIEGGQVAVSLGVEKGVDLPADSEAEVVVETFLGRRSVALHSGSSPEPLADGDVIPLERTITPVDVTDLNDISVELLEASDAEAFERFLADVSEVTHDRAEEIQTVIAGLEEVTRAVDSRREELGGLLRSLRIISTTLGERDRTLVSLIDNLDVVLGNLADRQRDLERLLRATDASSHETADLVRRNRGVLDSALRNLHVDLQVIDRHQLDLAATIAYLEQAVQGYSSVAYSSGVPNRWANIFVQSLGPAGVDALVGECGLVDQLFDELFGADCADGPEGNGSSSSADAPTSASEIPAPEALAPALPCTIGDVVDAVLEGTATVPMGSGRCES